MPKSLTKTLILFCFLLGMDRSIAQQSDTLKFIFFGNSITLTNDLPGLFEDMANSAGKEVSITNACIGGNLLDHLLENPLAVAKIDNEEWDFVILQLTPEFFTGGLQDSKIAVEEFVELIKENHSCTEIVFMMPWIYSDNIPSKIQSVQLETLIYADEFNARVNPAGLLWNIVASDHPEIEFYTDLIHPTYIGSYLAACGLYATIYKENLSNINYLGQLTFENAMLCQNTATTIVLDDLALWNLVYIAHFDPRIKNEVVKFENVTSNARYYQWDFGDATTSILENPVHAYADTGKYDVQLIIKSDSCFLQSDTLSKTLEITNISASINDIVFKPNPFIEYLELDLKQEYKEVTIDIIDMHSKNVFNRKYSSTNSIVLYLDFLASGSYFLIIQLVDDRTSILTKKIIKI